MAPLPQFILFGDSITQGANDQLHGFALASELQNAYNRRLDVINRGFSGYTTTHGLEVLPRFMPTPEQADVKFMTIWFGANDGNTNPEQNQHVPLPLFRENLISILNHPSITAHSPNLILITPSPFEETILKELQQEWGYSGPVRRTSDAQQYAAAVREIGAEQHVAVLDLWELCMEACSWTEGCGRPLPGSKEGGRDKVLEELLLDGLHLGPKGYKLLFDALVKLINEKWPEYKPYKMPFAVKVDWELAEGDQFWDVKNTSGEEGSRGVEEEAVVPTLKTDL